MRDFFVKLLCLIKTNAVKGVLLLVGWVFVQLPLGIVYTAGIDFYDISSEHKSGI